MVRYIKGLTLIPLLGIWCEAFVLPQSSLGRIPPSKPNINRVSKSQLLPQELESVEKSTNDDALLDVAIVGAGPAGLALAVVLKGKGLRIKVFEAAPAISERGAAVFIQPIGVAELDKFKPGLAAEVIAEGRPVDLIHLTQKEGDTIFKVDMKEARNFFGHPFLGITRYKLQCVFKRYLDDDELQVGACLHGITSHRAEGIKELSFDGHPDVVRARAVVGADGRRSVVRKKVLAENERDCDWALTWWGLADIPYPGLNKGEFRMSYSKRRAVYYGEVGDGTTMWSFTSWQKGEIEKDPELRAARALEQLEGWPEDLLNVVQSTRPEKIIEVFVGDSPLQWQTWSRQKGVTLLGDAAHAMLPTLGMGVTSAWQDVSALSRYVEGRDTPLAEAFVKYESDRRIPATLTQLLSRIAMIFIENFLSR